MLPVGDLPFKIQPDNDNETRKICILVKLTDSSVRSIEEFLKNKVRFSFKFFSFHLTRISK